MGAINKTLQANSLTRLTRLAVKVIITLSKFDPEKAGPKGQKEVS